MSKQFTECFRRFIDMLESEMQRLLDMNKPADSPRLSAIEGRLSKLEADRYVDEKISDRLLDDSAATIQKLENSLKEADAKIDRYHRFMRAEGFLFHPKGHMFVTPSQVAAFTDEQRTWLHVNGWRS